MKGFSACSMSAIVPEGSIGFAKIVHDRPDKFTKLVAAIHGQPLNDAVHTRLIVRNTLWMSDADFEWRTNYAAVHAARGDVLVAGLGIGFMVHPVLQKKEVSSVTVIEIDSDVVALVSPHISSKKLNIVNADAYKWIPPKRAYDCIYFDIWANVPNEDNAPEIKSLKKKYRPSLRPKGWMHAWCEGRAR